MSEKRERTTEEILTEMSADKNLVASETFIRGLSQLCFTLNMSQNDFFNDIIDLQEKKMKDATFYKKYIQMFDGSIAKIGSRMKRPTVKRKVDSFKGSYRRAYKHVSQSKSESTIYFAEKMDYVYNEKQLFEEESDKESDKFFMFHKPRGMEVGNFSTINEFGVKLNQFFQWSELPIGSKSMKNLIGNINNVLQIIDFYDNDIPIIVDANKSFKVSKYYAMIFSLKYEIIDLKSNEYNFSNKKVVIEKDTSEERSVNTNEYNIRTKICHTYSQLLKEIEERISDIFLFFEKVKVSKAYHIFQSNIVVANYK